MEVIDRTFLQEQLLKHWGPFCRNAGSPALDHITEQACQGQSVVVDRSPGGADMTTVETIQFLADVASVMSAGYWMLCFGLQARRAMASEEEFINFAKSFLPGVPLSEPTIERLRAFYKDAVSHFSNSTGDGEK
jgi:hypothetical protein